MSSSKKKLLTTNSLVGAIEVGPNLHTPVRPKYADTTEEQLKLLLEYKIHSAILYKQEYLDNKGRTYRKFKEQLQPYLQFLDNMTIWVVLPNEDAVNTATELGYKAFKPWPKGWTYLDIEMASDQEYEAIRGKYVLTQAKYIHTAQQLYKAGPIAIATPYAIEIATDIRYLK